MPLAEEFTLGDVPRLTAALKRGDERAFAWLHRAWASRIHRYCFALGAGCETLAGEIAQAVWLRVVRHIRVLPDEAALWNWLACAARHAASDQRRTGGRYRGMLERFTCWWQLRSAEAETASPSDHLLPALESALARLRAIDRALIEARYFSGESLEAVASRHALTIRAVEGRLARIRERLRQSMAEEIQKKHA
ncbi:MAG: RNA polymerase sigma factor [Chthoniobacter sp.]|uniref:RNA polymerase sigma factor n=1 Tax=Chthoniobacter sp. TaxID=2510640 RepID=UPI0032A25051